MDFKKIYFNPWREAWDFHREFAVMAGTDEDWQREVDTSGVIVEKYKDKPEYEFIKSLILTVVDELERVDKAR